MFLKKRGQPFVLKTKNIKLRSPMMEDFEQWQALRTASKAYLTPYEPTWVETDLSQTAFKKRIKRADREAMDGVGFSFFIFEQQPNHTYLLVGGINLSDIRRRVAQCVNIGYWMGESHANKGLMTQAVGRVLPFIFEELDLHRANAACLVYNEKSIRVLQKNGFAKEGLAEGFLKINGQWQDHLLFGLTKERFERLRYAK